MIYYNDPSAPGIVRIFQEWVKDDLSDGENWGRLLTKSAAGVTRVLPSYWDDWWNNPAEGPTMPEDSDSWYSRFNRQDYRGILDYASQVCQDCFSQRFSQSG